MPAHTTATEDRTLDACEAFGGEARSCADIVDRFDEEVTRLQRTNSDLEDRITELQEDLEELQTIIDELSANQ